MAALFGVVPDHEPAPVVQGDDLQARARVGDVNIGGRRPGLSPIAGRGALDPLRRIAFVAQVGDDRAVLLQDQAGLRRPVPHNGKAGAPRIARVVRNRDEREIEPIRIERQEDASGGQNERVDAGHPALLPFDGVLCSLDEHFLVRRSIGTPAPFLGAEFAEAALEGHGERVAGFQDDDVLPGPLWRPLDFTGFGAAVLEQGVFPSVGHDGGPEQPEPFLRIDKKHRVAVGQAGRIRHREHGTPRLRAVRLARALDHNVVGGPFAGAVEPAGKQIAVGTLDNAAGVDVFVLRGESTRP